MHKSWMRMSKLELKVSRLRAWMRTYPSPSVSKSTINGITSKFKAEVLKEFALKTPTSNQTTSPRDAKAPGQTTLTSAD